MSNASRLLVLVATVVVLAVALFVLSPGDEDESASTATTATVPTLPDTITTSTAAPEIQPEPAPEPRFETIRVRDGKPVAGARKLKVTKGDRVRIEVASPDTTDEVHIHGYDLSKDLKPGRRVRFTFEADAEGIFEIELEGAGVQIAELKVEPR